MDIYGIAITGSTPDSNIANYDSNNVGAGHTRASYYLELSSSNLAATRIRGEAGQFWQGSVVGISILEQSVDAAKRITLTDSNDPGALANKRRVTIGGSGPTAAIAGVPGGGFLPLMFGFQDGLVIEVTGPVAGVLRAMLIIPYVSRKPE